jgi:hypothetical protein
MFEQRTDAVVEQPAEAQNDAIDPELKSLIKTKLFVGAIGRDLADPPGAPFPDHPQ